MTFADALTAMRAGRHAYRQAWCSSTSRPRLDGQFKGTPRLSVLPAIKGNERYTETIIVRNEAGEAFIWSPSQASVLADDWEVTEGGR